MKKYLFLLGAMLVFSVTSAQTQRTTETKPVQKTTTVKAADGTIVQQTTTTTTVDGVAPDQSRQNTSDIVTPVGAKVNATDGQTAPTGTGATDVNATGTKTTTTTTTTKTTARP